MGTITEIPTRGHLAASVAGNIRAEAARRGLKQRALANLLGVSHTWVNARWVESRPWQFDDVERVAEVLGVEPLDLITGRSGRPRPDSNGQPTDYTSDLAEVIPFPGVA